MESVQIVGYSVDSRPPVAVHTS